MASQKRGAFFARTSSGVPSWKEKELVSLNFSCVYPEPGLSWQNDAFLSKKWAESAVFLTSFRR
jgi:hypothetical protein